MAETLGQLDPVDRDVTIEDVWSRTEKKYRRRATVLLIVNVGLFSGLAGVAYWLRTGVVFAPVSPDYVNQLAATFNPTLETQHTPTTLSLGPISIEQVPMMIPVLGLILAALVSIPILVTILYRITSSLPFVASVGLIAVMPWLAIALLASCLLVSVNPLRFRSRFATALLALLPVVLYFFMASRQAGSAVEMLSNPADRIKLMAPLILALIASAIVMGIVLIIARIVNYRPGAIAPLLAILFLTPAALFEFEVGRDELHYRLLEREYGPGSEYFLGERVDGLFDRAVERATWNIRPGSPDYGPARHAVEMEWMLALDADANLLFTEYQDRAAAAAERFVELFPESIYAINALHIGGRALDMRVDLERFRRDRELVFYDDFPSAKSRRSWELIEHNAPDTPSGADAMLRLAQLDVRDGNIDDAVIKLERLRDTFGQGDARPTKRTTVRAVGAIMTRQPPESSLDIPLTRKVLAGRELLDLIRENRDPLWDADPLVAMMHFDPRDSRYAENLRGILARYPGCQIADNIRLRIALTHADPDKRDAALRQCVERSQTGDARSEAIYRLGLARQDIRDLSSARRLFDDVVAEYPESLWREQAESKLRQLDRAATEQDQHR